MQPFACVQSERVFHLCCIRRIHTDYRNERDMSLPPHYFQKQPHSILAIQRRHPHLHIAPSSDALKHFRIRLLIPTTGQRLNHRFRIRRREERNRPARRADQVAVAVFHPKKQRRRSNNTMHRASPPGIAPALHQIPHVDKHRPGDRRHALELARPLRILDLEAADGVLEEQRQRAEVGVGGDAGL